MEKTKRVTLKKSLQERSERIVLVPVYRLVDCRSESQDNRSFLERTCKIMSDSVSPENIRKKKEFESKEVELDEDEEEGAERATRGEKDEAGKSEEGGGSKGERAGRRRRG